MEYKDTLNPQKSYYSSREQLKLFGHICRLTSLSLYDLRNGCTTDTLQCEQFTFQIQFSQLKLTESAWKSRPQGIVVDSNDPLYAGINDHRCLYVSLERRYKFVAAPLSHEMYTIYMGYPMYCRRFGKNYWKSIWKVFKKKYMQLRRWCTSV